MSLFIEVYVGSKGNKKLVANCHAFNKSNLKDISDYGFTSFELGEPTLDIPKNKTEGKILSHKRNQSVWALVEKIAGKSK